MISFEKKIMASRKIGQTNVHESGTECASFFFFSALKGEKERKQSEQVNSREPCIYNGVMPSSELSCNIAAIFSISLVGCWLFLQPFWFVFFKAKNQQQGTCCTWEWSVLFTEPLPLGSAPESLMLSMRFVTEAVVQVTARQNTLKELITLSRHPYRAFFFFFVPP